MQAIVLQRRKGMVKKKALLLVWICGFGGNIDALKYIYILLDHSELVPEGRKCYLFKCVCDEHSSSLSEVYVLHTENRLFAKWELKRIYVLHYLP